jgi:metal-responsive CopG/Arc/MetJ family transcriptional regulator
MHHAETQSKTKSNITKITVSLPKPFLERFDEAIDGYFVNRSEAVRRGMNFVLEEMESLEIPRRSTTTNQRDKTRETASGGAK